MARRKKGKPWVVKVEHPTSHGIKLTPYVVGRYASEDAAYRAQQRHNQKHGFGEAASLIYEAPANAHIVRL